MNPTRKSGLRTNIRFRLEDKEGNRLNEQIELSQIRIYEVVNGKEVMQFKYRIADGQTWPEDVPWLEPYYMWGKEWDDERIFDYYKSKGLRVYTVDGNNSYRSMDKDSNVFQFILLDFIHQVTQDKGKYIIRWNDQWSDEIEIEFNWARAKYQGKVGYMPGGHFSFFPAFKRVWLNGEIVLEPKGIPYDPNMPHYIQVQPDSGNQPVNLNSTVINNDIVCVH